jgi:hypothetical protein
MKPLFLASALALSVGAHAAFASMTIFSDGSTYDSTAPARLYASTAPATMSDATAWHRGDTVVARPSS